MVPKGLKNVKRNVVARRETPGQRMHDTHFKIIIFFTDVNTPSAVCVPRGRVSIL